jgi:hypothetical protein
MWTGRIAAAMLAVLGTTLGCGSGTSHKDVPRAARAFLGSTATDIDRVLGMDAPTTDWSILYSAAGSIGSSTTATQGASSLALSPRGWVPIKSIPLSSLGSRVGTALQLDLQYQGAQPNPYWFGTITLGADIPSKTVDSTQSGLIVNAWDLTGKVSSSGWSTLSFAIPTALQTALAGTYTDLTFTITLNVPTDFAGTYLIERAYAPVLSCA